MAEDDQSALFIDGGSYTMDDLTFREQRKMRDFIRELSPDNDPENASEADIVPPFITIIKQRTNPDFGLDQALDFKQADFAAPPTRPAKKKAAAKQ